MIEIQTIRLMLPMKIGSVNCYHIKTGGGHYLIDTGFSNQRAGLEKELSLAGCEPGDLKLIIITHGDFDHTGNAAYLRERFGCQIAMHIDDTGMAEYGDMFWNRKQPSKITRLVMPLFFGLGKADRFKPDLYLEDGDDLSGYGLEASVLSIPGHSKGSIGILTAEGDLFCGDLLDNTEKPALSSIMDNVEIAQTSVKKLKDLEIKTVYPGHGAPFSMEQLGI